VDAIFDANRNSKVEKTALTFSGMLNALDGVGNPLGQIFILTTNHKERLDPALIRKGRVDLHVEFRNATEEQIKSMFNNFYPSPDAVTSVDAGYKGREGSNAADADESKSRGEEENKCSGASDTAQDRATESDIATRFAKRLLAVLGERKIPMAALQHYFIRQRKSTAEEAVSNIDSILDDLHMSSSTPGGMLEVGARVTAKCDGWRKYYGGRVAAVNGDGTYEVQFDDGEVRRNVRASEIKDSKGGEEAKASEQAAAEKKRGKKSAKKKRRGRSSRQTSSPAIHVHVHTESRNPSQDGEEPDSGSDTERLSESE